MLKENNTLQKKSFSIHFFKNGFSFCTPKSVDFSSHPNTITEFENSIRNFLGNINQKNVEYFSIIFFHNPSALVPSVFFDKNKLDHYLSFYCKKPETEIIIYDELKKEDIINVYSIPKKVYNMIEKLDINFNILHYNSLLLNKVLNLCSSKKFSKQLFVHLHFDAMDLFLTKNNKLIFYNRFVVKNENDFMYYLFFVVEQFDLGPKDFEIFFLGRIDAFESYYDIVRNYHFYVSFSNEDHNTKIEFSKHHAPFLFSCFN